MNKHKENRLFYETVTPIKLTEGRKLKLNTEGWGLITDFSIDSVKINHYKKGKVSTVATLRISDRSGHITCIVRGTKVGLLFGLSHGEWKQVENLCEYKQQLFYRYFKNGIINSAPYEQKLFYNFCKSNQSNTVLVAKFNRCVNMRSKFKNEALLDIKELRTCDINTINLYVEKLRQS